MVAKKKKEPSVRQRKINSLLQKNISEILQAGNFFTPGSFVTISRVEVTADLREARVWLSIFQSSPDDVLRTLKDNMYDIQGKIYRSSTMKIVPKIKFLIDSSGEYYDHINSVLKNIDDAE